jgi:hypothetical protein
MPGVNVQSKAFGELVEHHRRHTRRHARDMQAMRDAGEKC